MKTFTLDEAQALLPILRSLLSRAVEASNAAQSLEEELKGLARRIHNSGGMFVDVAHVARMRTEQTEQVQRTREALEEIDAAGVQVKDLSQGLLDFPFMLEGEIVLLCWRLGEEAIAYWHTVDAGFRGRKPIDARFHPHSRPN